MWAVISLAGHTNLSCAEVGGVMGGGKNTLRPITPPTSAREKFVWPARLGCDDAESAYCEPVGNNGNCLLGAGRCLRVLDTT